MGRKLLLSRMGLFVLLCFSVVPSAEAASMWSKSYEEEGFGSIYSMIVDPDGGYVIGSDGALAKLDAFGNIQWNKTYPDVWRVDSVISALDGGYVIGGVNRTYAYPTVRSFSLPPPDFSPWMAKLDYFGNMEWNRTYEFRYDNGLRSLVATPDGGYAFVCGDLIVKTNSFGIIQWTQALNGVCHSLIVTFDGGFGLAGSRGVTYDEGEDFLLVKTDANGIVQWERTYGEARGGYDRAYALVATPDGGYALAGNGGDVAWDFWLVKTDGSGNLQWSKIYGGLDSEVPEALVVTSDGGFALAGSTASFGMGYNDIWLVKTDALGNLEWSQTFGGTGYDDAHALAVAPDGGYVVAGILDYEGWLGKTNELGVVPEYSSWLAPLLTLAALVPLLFYKKRLRRRCS